MVSWQLLYQCPPLPNQPPHHFEFSLHSRIIARLKVTITVQKVIEGYFSLIWQKTVKKSICMTKQSGSIGVGPPFVCVAPPLSSTVRFPKHSPATQLSQFHPSHFACFSSPTFPLHNTPVWFLSPLFPRGDFLSTGSNTKGGVHRPNVPPKFADLASIGVLWGINGVPQ